MVLERLCDSKTASAILHLSQILCLKNKHGCPLLPFKQYLIIICAFDYKINDNCEAQARVRQGRARDGP